MTLVDGVANRPVRYRPASVVRFGLAALWLVWAALAWWAAPREVGIDRLEQDLAAGRVVYHQQLDSWRRPGVWAAPVTPAGGQRGSMIAWVTVTGQTLYTQRPFRLEISDVPYRYGTSPLQQVASYLGLLLIGLGILVLLSPPDPVYGTRWFWFWITQLPFGVGYPAWLALERPWSARPPPTMRKSGWLGLGLMIIFGIIVTVVAALLGGMTGL